MRRFNIIKITVGICLAAGTGACGPGELWDSRDEYEQDDTREADRERSITSSSLKRLFNRHTKLCLQESYGRPIATTCSSAKSQQWKIETVVNGIYTLKNVQSGRCLHSHLDVQGGRPHIYTCNPAWWSTHWVSTSIGSGYIQLRGRHTGLCLGSAPSYKDKLDANKCNAGWWSQHWALQSPAPAPVPTVPIPGGLLSLDFDDNCTSHYTVAAPYMEAYGMRGTFYLLSAATILKPGHINLRNRGHEIGAHTVDHPDLTKLTDGEVIWQLEQSRDDLTKAIGVKVKGFASPFGYYNNNTLSRIRPRFSFHRTTDWGLNFPGHDVYKLRCHSIPPYYTPQQVRALIDEAKTKGGWRILLLHCLGNGSAEYSVTKFQQVLGQVKASGIRVVTASQGVKALRGY